MTQVATESLASSYVLPNAMPIARERLALLSEIYDPASQSAIERTGIGPGWMVWEVGAGEGSVTRWLGMRVGLSGRVIATDLDPSLITDMAASNISVLRHDVVNDPPPGGGFDLIHTRLLLCHLPDREQVLDRLVAALKPGGWLVIEDFDALSMTADSSVNPTETPLAIQAAVRELFRRRKVDLRTGRLLPGLLRQRGLAHVHAEGCIFMTLDGTRYAHLLRLTFEQVRDELFNSQLITREQFERDLRTLSARFVAPSAILWSVIGQRS